MTPMTRNLALIAAAGFAAVSLTACEEGAARRNAGTGADADGICKPFSAAPAGPADGSAVVEDCLHRWGYTLAASSDDAASVAEAVVAACSAPLARWNQQTLSASAERGLQEAPSLLTGQPTNPILEHNNFVQGRAMFYVVQARAGKCKPPRADREAARTPQPAAAAPAEPAYTPNSPDQ